MRTSPRQSPFIPQLSSKQTALTRRHVLGVAALGAAGLAAPTLRAESKIEKPRVTVAVGAKSAFYYLPLTVAQQLGFFYAEGIDVELMDYPGAARAMQALSSIGTDVAGGAYENTISLQGRGQYFQSFVLLGRAPQIAFGLSNRSHANVKSVTDLKGKKVGISSIGSSTHTVAQLVLTKAGLRAQDVSFVAVGSTGGAVSAVRQGQVDAISNMEPVMTMLEQKGDVRIVSDTRSLKGAQDVFGGVMPAGCLMASIEFIQRNPNTVQGLTNAVVHALKWLQTAGPGDIIKTVPEAFFLGDRGLYLASFNKVRESLALDGLMPEEGPRTALRALASFDADIQTAKVALLRTYTNEFARRAKAQFKA